MERIIPSSSRQPKVGAVRQHPPQARSLHHRHCFAPLSSSSSRHRCVLNFQFRLLPPYLPPPLIFIRPIRPFPHQRRHHEAHLQGWWRILVSWADSRLTRAFATQDLKQEKFVVEVEPSETVRDYPTAIAANEATPPDAGLTISCLGSRGQGQDCSGERRI